MIRSARGFTIVELLIVVVVIAILAAITVVAYNGIQQRAYNSAMVATAKQAYTALLQYTSQNGSYPLTTSDVELCLTQDNVCISNLEQSIATNNTALVNALRVNSSLPRSAPEASSRRGVVYYRYPTQIYRGSTDAAYVYYVLRGSNQTCTVGEIVTDARNQTEVYSASSGYSWVGGGYTGCYAYIQK